MNGCISRSLISLSGWRVVLLGLLIAMSQLVMADEPGASTLAMEAAEMPQVHINRADARTLAEQLDGIGQTRAEAIVAYREVNGAFSSVEDLSLVRGIGEVTLERNRDRIIFD